MMARAAGGKKFSKLNVSRVYFGNWLRDYSQAIDVGTVKSVSSEAIRLLLSILGFLTFGYGSGEFEVTADRLGCYRPEDHIDNPKNYADNIDARQYDRRLRAPVDERTELAIDQYTGMKNYIANERAGIMTSAQHIRNLFGRCIELGRSFNRSGNKPEKYEALRLLGTGLHCLEGTHTIDVPCATLRGLISTPPRQLLGFEPMLTRVPNRQTSSPTATTRSLPSSSLASATCSRTWAGTRGSGCRGRAAATCTPS